MTQVRRRSGGETTTQIDDARAPGSRSSTIAIRRFDSVSPAMGNAITAARD
jgi:hypothetical protein